MNQLTGKVAIISGGARGQGEAEARRFVAEGASVVIGDVLDDLGRATVASIGDRCHYVHLDVTSEADWAAIAAFTLTTFGRLDVLVNNAGIFRIKPLTDTSIDDWNQMIAINQTGVFLGMKVAAPIMISQKSGSIINISSVAGLGGAGGAFAYATTKWALRGMTRSAAQELAPNGVRVNSVHPGIIDTPMAQEFETAGVMDGIKAAIPMGRLASADEVANLVLYLASDESRYSTGSEFTVDGGMRA